MEKTKKLTEKLQQKLQPKAAMAANYNMAPTHFYISSLLLSFMGGIIITAGSDLHWPMLLVCGIIVLRILCSHFALLLICEHRMTSNFNIFMAELHNAGSDSLLLLPFAFIEGISGPLVVAVVILGILSQMVAITAVPMIQARRHDGPVHVEDRLLVFGGIALLVGVGIPALIWANIVLLVLLALQFATLVIRIRKALALSK